MKVLVISDFERKGGAAIACTRLVSALRDNGLDVVRAVSSRAGVQDENTRILVAGGRTRLVADKMEPFIGGSLAYRIKAMDFCKRLRSIVTETAPDVINLHNVHGAGWGPEAVFACASFAPLVWTLHDMWSFTGRCANAYDCTRFITGCDASCPTPDEYPALPPNRIKSAWKQRKSVLEGLTEIVGVSPSRWLAGAGKKGIWKNHRLEVIPNSLSLETFKPLDRHQARNSLGIKGEGPCLLAAAERLDERRNGATHLIPALNAVRRRPLSLAILGRNPPDISIPGVIVTPLGFLQSEEELARVYAAADLLLYPSLADNLPNVVMESLACGTPVAAYPIGGIPEMVRNGETGRIADEVNPASLAKAVDSTLDELEKGPRLRTACRAFAESNYSPNLQSQRYAELFESLLERNWFPWQSI